MGRVRVGAVGTEGTVGPHPVPRTNRSLLESAQTGTAVARHQVAIVTALSEVDLDPVAAHTATGGRVGAGGVASCTGVTEDSQVAAVVADETLAHVGAVECTRQVSSVEVVVGGTGDALGRSCAADAVDHTPLTHTGCVLHVGAKIGTFLGAGVRAPVAVSEVGVVAPLCSCDPNPISAHGDTGVVEGRVT